MLKVNFTQWEGKTQSREGRLAGDLAEMLHVTVGTPDAPVPQPGEPAPSLWHWTAFNPKVPMAGLAEDGHPVRGGFLPPVDLPRRMWAGGEVLFHAPIIIGDTLRQTSTIRSVDQKSDKMVLVTLDHQVYCGSTLAVSEVQNIVYLEIPKEFTPPKKKPTPAAPVFAQPVDASERLLFRYSAVTFNAHRIHYDLDYTRNVEKYPGLVVHGPLQATLLLAAAEQHTNRKPANFVYRGIHPMFNIDDLHLFGFDETDAGMSLCTGIPGGHQGLQATVKWRAPDE